MHSITHLLIGISIAFIFKIPPEYSLLFILASVLIDADHILELFNKKTRNMLKGYLTKKGNVKYKEINYGQHQQSIHIFHTFEVILLIFILSLTYYPLFWIGLAFLIHLVTDGIGNIWNRNLGKAGAKDWVKYWFVTYYIKQKSLFNR